MCELQDMCAAWAFFSEPVCFSSAESRTSCRGCHFYSINFSLSERCELKQAIRQRSFAAQVDVSEADMARREALQIAWDEFQALQIEAGSLALEGATGSTPADQQALVATC